MLNKAKVLPLSNISLMTPEPKLFHSYVIAKLVIFTSIGHVSEESSARSRFLFKLIARWTEVDYAVNKPLTCRDFVEAV